jgi:hypothetical protein
MVASAATIVRQVEFDDPDVSVTGLTCTVSLRDCPVHADPGEPLLPSYPLEVLLPQGEVVTSIKVTFSGESEIKVEHPLEWGRPQAPRSMPEVTEIAAARDIYEGGTPFPPERAVHVTTQTYRGYDIAYVRVYPLRYLGAERKILFASEVTVVIETAPEPARFARSAGMLRAGKPEDLSGLRRLLGQAGTAKGLEAYAPQLESYSSGTRPRALSSLVDSTDTYTLVIITTATCEPAFQTLKTFKDSRGLTTRVIRVNQITPHYDGLDLQDRIRKFIRDAYLYWETEYVLLGSDVEGIPHRGLYAEILPYVTDNDIPADIYYACLDGTWNDDSDSRWGEPGEDDLLPEVSIGRASVGSLTEATNFVDKIIRYESAPVVSQIKTAQMAGELIYDEPTWGGDEKDEIKDGSSAHGYTTAGIPPSYSVNTLYDRDLFPAEWSKWDLISLLNGGVHLVNHSGHCINWMCMKINTTDIPTSFTNDGISNSYMVIYAHGCYSAAFDNRTTDGSYVGDAVGEYFTFIENGAVAYIGNSRYGCGFHGDTRAAAQYYDRQFFDAIFGEGITVIGDTQTDSKIDNIPYIDFRGMRWTYYTLNLLADPSMDIWTDTPGILSVSYPETIYMGDNEVEIGVTSGGSPVADARVTIYSDSAYCGHGFTGDDGLAHVDPGTLSPGPVYLAVTAHDFYSTLDILVVAEPTQPLVILDDFTIDDDVAGSSSGNSDGAIDAGETIETKVFLRNIGQATAEDMSGVLRTGDPHVTMLDSSGTFADLPPGGLLTPIWAFAYAVDAFAADSHRVEFELELTYSDSTVTRHFSPTIHAPVLAVEYTSISDSLYGNGDACAGPGEAVEMVMGIRNTGSGEAAGVSVLLSEADPYASLDVAGAAVPLIPAGGCVETSPAYLLSLAPDCPNHHTVRLNIGMTMASGRTYGDSTGVALGGALDDDFETTMNGWTHTELIAGFYDQWHIETYRNHTPGGTYAWKFGGSGADPYAHYAHGALVTPELCLGPNASLTFWHWIQVELETGGYASDGGIVEISADGGVSWVQLTPVGGYTHQIYPGTSTPIPPYTPCYAWTTDWTQAEFDLSAYQGPARIRFNFGGGEHFEGEEGWYIDDVVVTDDYASVEIAEDDLTGVPAYFGIRSIRPNPATYGASVVFDIPVPAGIRILVFDARGRQVGPIVEGDFSPGRHSAAWRPGQETAPGVYFIRMTAPGFGETRKLILLRPGRR